MVEDWPYAGTDFTGDPDLPLSDGEDWDEEIGTSSFFFILYLYDFILLVHACPNDLYMHMQMLAQSAQPACLLLRGETILQQILRRRVLRGKNSSRTLRVSLEGFQIMLG